MNTQEKEIKAQIKSLQALLLLNQNIAKNSLKFNKLTKPQQRVAIAKDVLKQLALKRLTAKTGAYIDVQTSVPIKADDANKDLSLFLPQIKSCNACALGSMFMCAVGQADKFKVDEGFNKQNIIKATNLRDMVIGNQTHAYLGKFFSNSQLVSIENHFEQGGRSPLPHSYNSPLYKIPGAANQRLTLIMKNIIKNKGTFVATEFKANGKVYPNFEDND
jgi:hypothetical protein